VFPSPQGLHHWLRDDHITYAKLIKVKTRIFAGNIGKKPHLSTGCAAFGRCKSTTVHGGPSLLPLGEKLLENDANPKGKAEFWMKSPDVLYAAVPEAAIVAAPLSSISSFPI
jgi:hypothetical protein